MAVTAYLVTRSAQGGVTKNNGADAVLVWEETEEDAIAAANAASVGDSPYDAADSLADSEAAAAGTVIGSFKNA